jgi:hypothetical protein
MSETFVYAFSHLWRYPPSWGAGKRGQPENQKEPAPSIAVKSPLAIVVCIAHAPRIFPLTAERWQWLQSALEILIRQSRLIPRRGLSEYYVGDFRCTDLAASLLVSACPWSSGGSFGGKAHLGTIPCPSLAASRRHGRWMSTTTRALSCATRPARRSPISTSKKSPGRRSAAKLLKIEALASIHFEDRRHQAIFVGIIYHQLPRLLPE